MSRAPIPLNPKDFNTQVPLIGQPEGSGPLDYTMPENTVLKIIDGDEVYFTETVDAVLNSVVARNAIKHKNNDTFIRYNLVSWYNKPLKIYPVAKPDWWTSAIFDLASWTD